MNDKFIVLKSLKSKTCMMFEFFWCLVKIKGLLSKDIFGETLNKIGKTLWFSQFKSR